HESEMRPRVRCEERYRSHVGGQLRLHTVATRASGVAVIRAAIAIRNLEWNELVAHLRVEERDVVLHARHRQPLRSGLVRRRELRLEITIQSSGTVRLIAELRRRRRSGGRYRWIES